MVIVAHPGDEAFGFAGAIAAAAAEGAYVVVVCATRGYFDPRISSKPPAPGGRNRDLLESLGWRNLDTVREDEMRRSAALLGVRVLRMLDYAEGDLPAVDYEHLVGRLVEPIRMTRTLERLSGFDTGEPYTFIECVQTIFPVNGVAKPVVAGTEIPYRVPDMYNRPWAKIWEEYHEKGMQRPAEKPLITFE